MKRAFLAMVAVVFAFIPQAYAQEYQEITEIGGEPETRLTVKLPVEVPPNVIKDIEAGFDELGIPYIPVGLPEVTLTPEEIAALPPEQRELIAEYKELKDLLAEEVESKLLDARIEELQKELAALAIASPAAEGAEEVYIPDPGLEAVIREEIDKLYGPIYVKDLEGLTRLDASKRGIADLTGMEYCTDLESLSLPGNKITDLSPLSQLVNLEELNLSHNEITDLSPLSQLVNLKELRLGSNEITDLSLLSQLWAF